MQKLTEGPKRLDFAKSKICFGLKEYLQMSET